jgi:hypothetical protein
VTLQDKPEDKKYADRYVRLNDIIFDNEVYYKRLTILAETVLLEADHRAKEAGRDAFLNIIGCGKYCTDNSLTG